jgi:quinohemoprotein amine dehydrogenase
MWGRWFTGAYDEVGMDVKLARLTNAPIVLGTSELSVKRGASNATLHVFGANLPTVTAADVSLGQGLRVTQITDAGPTAVTLQVSVAPDATPGPRDISIGGTVHPSAFTVFDKIDGIQVLPRAGLARIGGIVFPKQLQQFEAMAYANGPDGKPDTGDDVPLGIVDAKWAIEEYPATLNDDDAKFVGSLDSQGLFTPNNDGPNPERVGNRDNVGDVWIVATYTPEGASEPLRARAHLLVTVPLYMKWMASEGVK